MFKLLLVLSCLFYTSIANGYDVKTYIPKQAYSLLPLVKEEAKITLPQLIPPAYFGALIETESCISLTHSKCWNPKSRLKSAREEGGGLGQITKAYNKNGSIRFDGLTDLRRQYKSELKDLSWGNLYQRPDLQIKATVLLTKNNYLRLIHIPDTIERLAMTDAAYNGGLGGLQKDRRACGLSANCNPNIWFNNIEKHCTRSRRPIYGDRSPCDIIKDHVSSTVKLRLPKYMPYF